MWWRRRMGAPSCCSWGTAWSPSPGTFASPWRPHSRVVVEEEEEEEEMVVAEEEEEVDAVSLSLCYINRNYKIVKTITSLYSLFFLNRRISISVG
jgi:hypothetical protein